jgi:hypothetical protein
LIDIAESSIFQHVMELAYGVLSGGHQQKGGKKWPPLESRYDPRRKSPTANDCTAR